MADKALIRIAFFGIVAALVAEMPSRLVIAQTDNSTPDSSAGVERRKDAIEAAKRAAEAERRATEAANRAAEDARARSAPVARYVNTKWDGRIADDGAMTLADPPLNCSDHNPRTSGFLPQNSLVKVLEQMSGCTGDPWSKVKAVTRADGTPITANNAAGWIPSKYLHSQ
jgi:hypothetical protein